MAKQMTLLAFLERTPPVMVRSMAVLRQKGHNGHVVQRKTMAALIAESGIPRRTFQRLSYLPSWGSVPIDVASRFCAACGVDILKPKPTATFLRGGYNRHRFAFLTTRQRRKIDTVVKQIRETKP